jgi:hypothetical protein
MPAGIEVYGPTGVLQISITTRLVRISGTITTTANVAGSVTVVGSGTPFYYAKDPNSAGMFSNATYPEFTLNGNVISWTAATRSLIIDYGLF